MLRYPVLIQDMTTWTSRTTQGDLSASTQFGDYLTGDNFFDLVKDTTELVFTNIERLMTENKHVDWPQQTHVMTNRVGVGNPPIEVESEQFNHPGVRWVRTIRGNVTVVYVKLNTAQHYQILIHNKMVQLGITKNKLKELMGIEHGDLDNVLGLHKHPSIVMIDQIMTALGFDVDITVVRKS